MPVVALLEAAPAANEPMRAAFFMRNLGPGAAAAGLISWLLYGVVLAAGRMLRVGPTAFSLAAGGAVLAAAIALLIPALGASSGSDRLVEGRLGALPDGPFISVLKLPQP